MIVNRLIMLCASCVNSDLYTCKIHSFEKKHSTLSAEMFAYWYWFLKNDISIPYPIQQKKANDIALRMTNYEPYKENEAIESIPGLSKNELIPWWSDIEKFYYSQ